MLQMTFVNCIAILSSYFGGEVKFVLVAKVNKSLTRIFSGKISEYFRINTYASKTWLKYRPSLFTGSGSHDQDVSRAIYGESPSKIFFSNVGDHEILFVRLRTTANHSLYKQLL